MGYLGNSPAEKYSSFTKQDFSTSATTSYTLSQAVANENEIALFINFVRQEPTTAYTASGTSLTLTSATSSSDDMYCVYLGKAVQTVNPPSGSVGTSQLADSAVTAAKLASGAVQNQSAFKNLVINGDMSIAQRGASHTTASGYTLDRYTWTDDSTSAFTITQSTDVPSGQGFANSMKLDCTTANTSLGSSDQIRQVQKIEAQNLQHLRYGTSSAKSVTLSFWVKSNKTGTYCATLSQEDDSYASFTKEYTISSSNTWEKKTLTFDGDTGGVINNDTGAGLWLMFAFGAGSGRHMTADQWNSSYGLSTSNQVNLADSTSNELYLTGVQLEIGTSASDFEFLPHDINLARCQRYCYVVNGVASDETSLVSSSVQTSTSNARVSLINPVPMRAYPSVYEAGLQLNTGGGAHNISVASLQDNVNTTFSPRDVVVNINADSGTPFTVGQSAILRLDNATSAFLKLEAEL